jgi:hypothetical protein
VRRGSQHEQAAHRYADTGWNVFPCQPGGKIPATPHGFLDATTDHRAIQRWWRAEPRANVAIATGRPGPDVLDVDVRKDGSGFGAFNQLKREGLVPEPIAVVRTPSGGMHAYYAGSYQRNGHIPGKHLDFRSQGGYVVSPPSAVDGRPYVVVRHQPSAATFDWAAAKELLDPQPRRQPASAPQRAADGPRDVGHLAAWVASQPEGNRNAGLFWAASRAVEAGDTATLDGLARAARDAGLEEREIDRTIRSAQQTATRGAGRPFEHQARDRERAAAVPARREPQAAEATQAQVEAEAGS